MLPLIYDYPNADLLIAVEGAIVVFAVLDYITTPL